MAKTLKKPTMIDEIMKDAKRMGGASWPSADCTRYALEQLQAKMGGNIPVGASIPIPEGSRLEKKRLFIRAMAEYLVGNEAGKSIALEVETKGGGSLIAWAQEWAKVRSTSPLFGYMSVEEAEAKLWELLG